MRADVAFGDVDPGEVGIVVIPGGYAPDRLRCDRECLRVVSGVAAAGGVVAFICHGGWVPISAGIVSGKRVTSFPAIRDDLVNAGAEWVDESCVVDGNMVTAQVPDHLPPFMEAVIGLADG